MRLHPVDPSCDPSCAPLNSGIRGHCDALVNPEPSARFENVHGNDNRPTGRTLELLVRTWGRCLGLRECRRGTLSEKAVRALCEDEMCPFVLERSFLWMSAPTHLRLVDKRERLSQPAETSCVDGVFRRTGRKSVRARVAPEAERVHLPHFCLRGEPRRATLGVAAPVEGSKGSAAPWSSLIIAFGAFGESAWSEVEPKADGFLRKCRWKPGAKSPWDRTRGEESSRGGVR